MGAVIDLGHCLDLTRRAGVDLLSANFELFKAEQIAAGLPMPVNQDLRDDPVRDRLLRYLDRAVIGYLHASIDKQVELDLREGKTPSVAPFDTVRGLFPEGEPAYEGAGFLKKTHTQIAVRNPACIRGVFWPRGELVSGLA